MSWGQRPTLLAAAILVAAVFAVYANSLRAPFILDDIPAITENPTIRDLTQFGAVLSPPSVGSGATGRPLVNLSFALNYAIGGLEVFNYHLTNVAIHALATLALFGLVRRTLAHAELPGSCRDAIGTIALAIALLWSVHPLQTESVTCIVQRTESVVSLFYLVTLYAFVRAVASPHPGRWFAVAWGACLAGMATKEVMVTAPVMTLFYDRTFLAGSFAHAWRRRGRWYLALATTWILLAYLVIAAGANRGMAAGFGLGMSSWDYLLTQTRAIVLYLKLSVWPDPLIADYGNVLFRQFGNVAFSAAAVLALVAATIVALVRRSRIAFAGVWFLGILAPSSSVVPLITQTIAEHRMYLPLAAVIALVVLALFRFAPRAAPWLCVALAGVAAGTTVARNKVYHSERALWQDTVTKWPAGARPRANLGRVHFLAGDWERAIACYEESLRLDSFQPKTEYNLGLALDRIGRFADAAEHYAAAVRILPQFANAHYELGRMLRKVGRPLEAEQHFAEALRFQPELPEAHVQLGLMCVEAGRLADGTAHYAEALRQNPALVDAESNWGAALYRAGDVAGALAHLQRAATLDPLLADVQFNLGLALAAAGRVPEAQSHFAEAVRLNPDHVDARLNFGVALARQGRLPEALEQFTQATALRPDSPDAHVNRANVLLELHRVKEAMAEYEAALHLQPNLPGARDMLDRLHAAPDGAP